MQGQPPPNPYGPQGYGPQGYGPQGYGPPPGYPPQAPMGMMPVDPGDGGTSVLIWGILGFALCALCAPVAWVKGNAYAKTCQAMGVRPSSAGTVGRVLGIVGTVLLILGVLGGGLSVCASALSH